MLQCYSYSYLVKKKKKIIADKNNILVQPKQSFLFGQPTLFSSIIYIILLYKFKKFPNLQRMNNIIAIYF